MKPVLIIAAMLAAVMVMTAVSQWLVRLATQ
jgi:hypothetical protein